MISTVSFLIGERIYLRSLQLDDAEGPYLSWFNNDEVCRGNSHHVYPYVLEEAREYILTTHKKHTESLVLAIISKDNEHHIGNIALQNINPVVHSAEMSIIIGDKSCWGQGIGNEACKLICDHGFRQMNLSRISCGTFETNISMIKIAQYLGMKEEGRRRNAAYKNGKFLDVIEFGILNDEYYNRWFNKK
jgi:[ribosomal protein S5]-alanine N-acetyltransferase